MKTIIICLSAILFFNISQAQVKLYKWDEDSYAKYTHETFLQLDVLNETINAKKVDYKLLSAALFYYTNKARTKQGLDAFSYSDKLYASAQGHSEDMVKNKFYSHTSTVKGKASLTDRLRLVDMYPLVYSENLSNVTVSPKSYSELAKKIVDAWMNSTKHKANILHPELKYLACGIYNHKVNSKNQLNFLATQNFSSSN